MAIPAWPNGLPFASNRDQYAIQESGRAPIASEMEVGRTRMRPRSTLRIAKMTVSIQFTAAELGTFRDFVDVTLGQGCARFTMPVWNARSQAHQSRTVQIVGGASGIAESDLYQNTMVSMTLLVEAL